jgi:hypothetical protein
MKKGGDFANGMDYWKKTFPWRFALAKRDWL